MAAMCRWWSSSPRIWKMRQLTTLPRCCWPREIDGVIATNTTLSRDGVQHIPQAAQDGGLSGAPLKGRSTRVIRRLSDCAGRRHPHHWRGRHYPWRRRLGKAQRRCVAGADLQRSDLSGPATDRSRGQCLPVVFYYPRRHPASSWPGWQASTLTPGETPAAETPAADAQTPATDAATPTVANPEGRSLRPMKAMPPRRRPIMA